MIYLEWMPPMLSADAYNKLHIPLTSNTHKKQRPLAQARLVNPL